MSVLGSVVCGIPGEIVPLSLVFMTSLEQGEREVWDLTREEEDMLAFGKVKRQKVSAKTCITETLQKSLIDHAGQSVVRVDHGAPFYLASMHEPEEREKGGILLG